MKRGKLNRTKSQLFVMSLIVKILKVARIPNVFEGKKARILNTVHTHVLAKRVKMYGFNITSSALVLVGINTSNHDFYSSKKQIGNAASCCLCYLN
jgi:hypothetical protein